VSNAALISLYLSLCASRRLNAEPSGRFLPRGSRHFDCLHLLAANSRLSAMACFMRIVSLSVGDLK
jgi:hypothetical protein